MRIKPDFKTVCSACEQTRRREDLLYSVEDLKPYCANMTICVDAHPNSYKNFAKTQKTVKMVSYSEAAEIFKQNLKDEADQESIAALNMLEKPIPVRVKEFEMAKYLLQVKEERQINSMNLTMLAIIEDHRRLNMDASKLVALDEAKSQSAEDFRQMEEKQIERIEELNAVNKPEYKPEDDNEDVI